MKERQITEVKLIRPSNMNYCDIYCDNAMTSTMTLRVGGVEQQRNGTRMTRIGRIFTGIHYPCASASSAQSVFYRNSIKINEYKKTTEGTEDTEKENKPLCSLCSPWLNNLAGINFSGFNACALEYSIFTQGERLKEAILYERR